MAEYERSLEESGDGGKEGLEKGSWEAKDSPEKMCGMWMMCSDCFLCFDRYNEAMRQVHSTMYE